MLWLVTGLSVSALLSALCHSRSSLQRARPEARRTKMQICVWSVRCKYATHFNRKGLPQCEIFLQRFLRFLLRIIIA